MGNWKGGAAWSHPLLSICSLYCLTAQKVYVAIGFEKVYRIIQEPERWLQFITCVHLGYVTFGHGATSLITLKKLLRTERIHFSHSLPLNCHQEFPDLFGNSSIHDTLPLEPYYLQQTFTGNYSSFNFICDTKLRNSLGQISFIISF